MGVMPITSGVTLFVIGTVINIFSVTPIGEYFMYVYIANENLSNVLTGMMVNGRLGPSELSTAYI
jgi:hypothetical protein